MKRLLLTAAAVTAFGASAGFAESKAVDHEPAMPAVATSSSVTPAVPAAGSNSFTEEQVKERLAKKGYSKVSGLKNDENGVWRGTATKKGVKHSVAVDYQGNVTAE